MMAPYAIAHMKIGLKLAETGYRFGTEERARIYLTNALEPWVKQLPLIGFDALAHEAAAVNEIKRHKRFTVVIGNPPWSGISSNMSEYAQRIVDAYKFVDGAALNERKLWLQDDYVKFIRKAQTIIDCTTVGVFGFITNNGYLGNPTFRGMRQSLMATFPRLQVLDLHGNSNKKEQSPDGSEDKNVFDIRQGVSICLAARGGSRSTFGHADSWGSRDAKYAWLSKHWVSDTVFSSLHPDSPFYFFEPQNIDCRAEFDKGWKITEVMPIQTTGVITSRDAFATDTNEKLLRERIAAFISPALSDKDLKERFALSENYQWRVHDARIVAKNVGLDKIPILRCCYRPFDERYIAYHQAVVWRPRASVTTHLELPGNLSLITARSNKASVSDHFYCSRVMSEAKCGEYSTQSCFFPLYLKADEDTLLESEAHPNFAPGFLKAFSATLNLPQKGTHGLPAGLTPEDIFHYAYAVFHSPGYRSRYVEFLKIDFPRLPLTGNLELFRALSRLGGELVALHLLESPALENPRTQFVGPSREVVKAGWVDGTVWIDAGGKKSETRPGTSGFRGVPEAVWNFHIGGYQVCEKWLKDRKGRMLTDDDIAHYHKIVISLDETIRLMSEIDEVINQHGGWPGAFQTAQP
jgi:predicted helicase